MKKFTRMKFKQALRLLWIPLWIPWILAISSGEQAPPFSAKNQEGKDIQLSDYKDKYVLIFFYPKDDTPGCTKEACSFRDQYATLKKMNAVILGVSKQDEKSHVEFKKKHKLPFDLLVDKDEQIAKKYGVGTMPVIGLLKRKSVLIGPNGKVIRFYEDVDPKSHADEVIRDIESASKKATQ